LAQDFSEGLAAVIDGGKWGYIDNTGQFVISPQYGFAQPFSDGLAAVSTAPSQGDSGSHTLFGYIDKSGTLVIPERYNWAQQFSEGLAAACEGPCRDPGTARKGYIDKDGDYIIPAQFSLAGPFSGGLAPVSLSRNRDLWEWRYGFIDRSGQFVIPPLFRSASPFSEGFAATSQGFINRNGELAIAAQAHPRTDGFSDGLALIRTAAGTTFVDTNGKIALELGDWSAEPFSEGLAPACKSDCGPSSSGRNWGYINKRGEFVIEPQFGAVGQFSGGLARVCVGCSG
jgi:hypothetical protein